MALPCVIFKVCEVKMIHRNLLLRFLRLISLNLWLMLIHMKSLVPKDILPGFDVLWLWQSDIYYVKFAEAAAFHSSANHLQKF
jgi:hypothetical protein